MKIEEASITLTPMFGELKIGDVFLKEGRYFMKIKEIQTYNTVGLNDGDIYRFNGNESVTKVDATLMVNR